MKKICFLDQTCGIGDIIFCQGISSHFSERGYDVIWPVEDIIHEEISCLNTKAIFVKKTENFVMKNIFEVFRERKICQKNGKVIYFPLYISSHILEPKYKNILCSKYDLCDLHCTNWQHHFSFIRKRKKENELFHEILDLKEGEKYCLVNENFCTQPNIHKKDMEKWYSDIEKNGIKICKMKIIEGFTIFDWCKVFENMDSIVTIDTSLMYILEKLHLKAKKFLCFPRAKDYTKNEIKHVFKINWEYVYD